MTEDIEPAPQASLGDRDPQARLAEPEQDRLLLIERLRQAEAALRVSEERYQRLAQATTDYIYAARVENGCVVETRHGPGCVTVTGYSSEDYAADSLLWHRMVVEDDRPAVEEQARRILAGEPVDAIEHRIVHRDGRVRWVRNTPVPHHDAAGQLLGYDGLIQDVTERKQAEEALRESDERYRQLFDSGGDAVFVHELLSDGRPGRFLEANETACRRLGYSREELLALAPRDINAPWNPADIALVLACYAAGQPATFEQVHLSRNGQRIPVEIHGRPFTFKGRPAVIALVRDITERKRAEAALRESEARYRQLFEMESDALVLVDNQTGRILEANAAATETYGYSREEWLSLHNTDVSVEPDATRTATTTGLTQIPVRWHRKKDGTIFPVEITARHLELGGRQVHIAAMRDISSRLRVEEELRESEQKFRMMADQAPIMIGVTDRNGQITFLNKTWLDFRGRTLEKEAGGARAESLHPEDRDHAMAAMESAIRQQRPYSVEYRIQNRTGDYRWILDTAAPMLDPRGQPEGYIGTALDITERKQAEEALRQREEGFRAIVETTQEWIWAFDMSGRHTYSNPSLANILGYSTEEIVGTEFWGFMHPDDRPQVEAMLREKAATGEGWSGLVVRWRHKDGSYRYLESNAVPLFDREGHLTGYQGADRDITERKRVEEEKDRLQAQLIQAQKMEAVGRLAGGVAHDFNNLLMAMLGYAELELLHLDRSSRTAQTLLNIREVILQATSLTQQILAFGRKQILTMSVLDLNAAIRSAEKMLRRLIGEDIAIHTQLQPELGRVRADSSQLQQILINLAVNARDAMPSGGSLELATANISLDEETARAWPDARPGDFVSLTVSDTGSGMDAEILSHVFEPFFTTKEMGRGTGLGLATVYGIVKQHGGHIDVASMPRAGARFRILLPRVTEEPRSDRDRASLLETAPGSETILLVEDDSQVRKLIGRRLSDSGYRVLSADGPAQALEMARQHDAPIEILLTDVVMPDMTGPELHAQLAAERPQVKVLYMSGYPGDMLAQDGRLLDHGLNFIQKPFSIADLAGRIRSILDGTL